jgi:hypothetical protein
MTARQTERYEYRVFYRRRCWKQRQVRLYQSAPPVRRFAAKLRRPWRDLEPVVEIAVQRRRVGEWEDVTPAELFGIPTEAG